MKQTILRKLMLIAVLLTSSHAFAHDFEVDGIYYKITSSTNMTVSVTYKGDYFDSYNEYQGEVTIPSKVWYGNKSYDVTRVRTYAFKGCTDLTKVTIQGSVTYIESEAFMDCTSLVSVNLNSELTTIGQDAFNGCTSLEAIMLPENLSGIAYNAFYNTNLKSIIIPKSVKTIQRYAFNFCPNLKSIVVESGNTTYDSRNNCNAIIETATNKLIAGCNSTIIPNTIESIDIYAFAGSGITSISIPEKCVEIGYNAFTHCSNLSSIQINSNIERLPSGCFSQCTNLTSISLPENLTTIGYDTFKECYSLSEIKLPNVVTLIESSAFYNCTSLKAINLPENIEEISNNAFWGCKSLSSIDFPNNISKIGYRTFYNCTNLNEISIPNSITSIYGNAFENTGWYQKQANGILYLDKCCLGYKGNKPQGNLQIKNDTRIIAGDAFDGCTGLTSITIPNSVTIIGSGALSETGLTSIAIPNSVSTIDNYAFSRCTDLSTITIPESITTISAGTFEGCSGLTSVNIPNSVTSIKNMAFQNCSGLTSIIIPNSVTELGSYAFFNCSNLAFVNIPNNITRISDSTFSGCSGLTSIIIPSSVSDITSSAFNDCNNIIEVISQNVVPPLSYDIIFKNIPTTAILYVPIGSKDAYANATGWKNFTNIIEDDVKTGVESTLADDVNVSVENGNIVIGGAENANVEVYNVNGQCVYSGNATSIPVVTKGLYIVKVNNKSFKVIL